MFHFYCSSMMINEFQHFHKNFHSNSFSRNERMKFKIEDVVRIVSIENWNYVIPFVTCRTIKCTLIELSTNHSVSMALSIVSPIVAIQMFSFVSTILRYFDYEKMSGNEVKELAHCPMCRLPSIYSSSYVNRNCVWQWMNEWAYMCGFYMVFSASGIIVIVIVLDFQNWNILCWRFWKHAKSKKNRVSVTLNHINLNNERFQWLKLVCIYIWHGSIETIKLIHNTRKRTPSHALPSENSIIRRAVMYTIFTSIDNHIIFIRLCMASIYWVFTKFTMLGDNGSV